MRPDRPLQIAAFLDQHGWGEAQAHPFDGDFSPRRYARLNLPDGRGAILMDADEDQKTPAFVSLANRLIACGIDAPQIFADDAAQGLVLMKDFGARNVGALWDGGTDPRPFFLRAAALLAKLHRRFDRAAALSLDLPLFNTDLFVLQVELFLDGYFPFATGRAASDEERQDFRAAWRAVLRPIDVMPKSLLLRDFMADNLMDLPDGKLGVLDFQDAGIGPTAYDLASLCEEIRRDGGFALLPDIIRAYRAALIQEGEANPLSESHLTRACTILSAQRHTRILGIVTQLAARTGKRDKLDYLPRLWRHLNIILAEPYLMPVREWMNYFESTKE